VKIVAIANLTLSLERETEGVIEDTHGKLLRKADYDRNGHPQTLVYREGNASHRLEDDWNTIAVAGNRSAHVLVGH
jgi:hypothetical protein